ncbi:type III pantothenate kinase [Cupriavidus sp. AU9028]|uniref:type III pantothenate kinase n=1 Tax=Cupriavidus sp. AU9028 TaxID=2871157 RepID=UPI001C9637CA|nr:type III pantothenate kinase [Cupriavidus sp. AU9028]MBY4896763.1 type III pantothenate kinase [Cupriavidus sp. AU9028]
MTAAPRLLIDIGNTRLKWAWCPGDGSGGGPAAPWTAAGALPHDRIGELPQRLVEAAGGRIAAMPETWASNVAGPGVAARLDEVLASAFALPSGAAPVVHWARSEPAHDLLDNGYREPARLGVDRWIGSIGARALHPQGDLMIVTAGTATTIDIVSAPRLTHGRSRFEGGLILPGLALMMGSLARNTAQLPELEMAEIARLAGSADRGGTQSRKPAAWADNTRDAIAAGCLSAQVGAVERIWREVSARGPARCLLSGGAREVLGAAMPVPFELHENLVLLGLAVLAGAFVPAQDAPPR